MDFDCIAWFISLKKQPADTNGFYRNKNNQFVQYLILNLKDIVILV